MNVTNKTKQPLSLPLPGGKKLFLGPGQTGQVTPKALKHPPLAKLIESGDVETAEGGSRTVEEGIVKDKASSGSHHGGSGATHQAGDR